MTTVAISLKDKDRSFLEEAVKSGRFFSESEVVAEAFAEFRVREVKGKIKQLEIDGDYPLGSTRRAVLILVSAIR